MRDEVAVKSASQILATGGITEQQLQLLHSEKTLPHWFQGHASYGLPPASD